MTDREAMKQAQERLELWLDERGLPEDAEAIAALRERLEQPEQEPVAWMDRHGACMSAVFKEIDATGDEYTTPLYTTPPQRKPLTHEQRFDVLTKFEPHKHEWHAPAILIDLVEAAHGIKEEA